MKGRKTGGRLKGTCNKATVEIKELVRRHALIAVRELARLATNAQSEQAHRRDQGNTDRGYGRPGEASQEPNPSQQEGIVIEPFRKPEQNERAVKGPIRLEDFRQYYRPIRRLL
jgi:hypothetical protein